MNKKDFVEYIINHIKKRKVKLVIGKGRSIDCDGLRVGGYFDEINRILKIAGGNKRWFEILCHEYCHYLQWIENSKYMLNFNEKIEHWDNWIMREVDIPQKKVNIEFLAARNLELDCERRVIQLIKKYDLDINVKRYIQGANAYMYFLAYVKKNRCWPPKLWLTDKEILDSMSTKLCKHMNDYNKMPKGFEKLINEHSK